MTRRGTTCTALVLALGLAALAGCLPQQVKFCITADNRGFPGFAAIVEKIRDVPGGPGVLMISNGDIDPPKATHDTVVKVLGPTFGWIPVVGNHDTGYVGAARSAASAPRYFYDYFNKNLSGKVNPGPDGCRETTFSFDVGDCHIVILNEYWNGRPESGSDTKGDGTVVAPLSEWLARDLATSGKRWKLVFGHVPAYSQPDEDFDSSRHPDSEKTAPDRDAFWKVLEEQGVAAYVCGHTHRYSRYCPPGSTVWQIDAAQARGGSDWQYDAFVIVTVDSSSLRFDVYRNLKSRGRFAITDSLALPEAATPTAAAKIPAAAPTAR